MVNIDEAVIARLNKAGNKYEILVDCELAMKLKRGEKVDLDDVLAVKSIYKDAKKGEVAPKLEEVFKTDDIYAIAKEIITKGEVQLNLDYKRKLAEEKKKQILDKIIQNAMDARTKSPIPLNRLENALNQAKINFDPFKSVEEQTKEVIEKLRSILPLSFEKKKYKLMVPASKINQVYNIIKKYSNITKEEWLSNGALSAEVEMPAGMSIEFIDKLSKATHGDIYIEEVK